MYSGEKKTQLFFSITIKIKTMKKAECVKIFKKADAFVFINGSLVEGSFACKNFKFDYEDEEGHWHFKADSVFVTNNGKRYLITDENKVFESVEDYEANKPAETRNIDIADYRFYDVGENGQYLNPYEEYWTFDSKKGEPIKHEFAPKEFYYEYTLHVFFADTPHREKIYKTREEALSFNTYKVTDKNGNVTERNGVGKLLMLDGDQEELVMQLERTMQELEKAGVSLIMDSQEVTYAFNIRNVDCDFDDSVDEPCHPIAGEPEEYEKFDRFNDRFAIKSTIEQWSDCFNMFVRRRKINK